MYNQEHCIALQLTVTQCSTLQHTATHCNTLIAFLSFDLGVLRPNLITGLSEWRAPESF